MLETFESKLKEFGLPVFYGIADPVEDGALWDYIVFSRDHTSRSQNNRGYSDYLQVALVHENYIPVGFVEEIVDKLESIPGVRLAQSDVQYIYTRKDSTNAIIELAVMVFVCPRKRV